MGRDVLFRREAVAKIGEPAVKNAGAIEVVARKPYVTPHDWFWRVLSGGRLERYEVHSEGKVVSWVYCVGRVYQFPFMGRGDLHIGPAFTLAEYRGRGFYKMLMAQAMKEHREGDCWMIVEDDNYPSLSAVEAVGFRRVAYLKQNRLTKVFRVVQKIEKW